MKHLTRISCVLALLAVLALALPTSLPNADAGDGEKKVDRQAGKRKGGGGDKKGPTGEGVNIRELAGKFDKDGDGKLNQKERAALKKHIEKMRKQREKGKSKDSERPGKRKGRGKDGEQPAGRRGKDGERGANLTDEQKAKLRELAAKFDINGDAKLGPAERAAMSAYLKTLKKIKSRKAGGEDGDAKAGDRRRELAKKFDKNGDGQLDDKEKAALKKHVEKMRSERSGEGRQGGKGDADTRKELAEKFDKNGDGKLDDKERAALKKYIEKMRKERRKDGSDRPGRGGGKNRERPGKGPVDRRPGRGPDGERPGRGPQ